VADFVVRRWDLAPYPGDQAPPHIHHKGDEAFCVVSGQLEVLVGDRRRTLGPGDHVVVPAGTIHTFATVGDETARVMVVMTPQIDALVQALHTPGQGDWDSVWEQFDSEMVHLDEHDRPV
jgi:quercetin dioxygenase-like cupin family protein